MGGGCHRYMSDSEHPDMLLSFIAALSHPTTIPSSPHSCAPLMRKQAWSTRQWLCLRTLHGRHEDTTWPCALALSPDGTLLVSASTGLFGASTLKAFQAVDGVGVRAGDCLATFAQLRYDEKGDVCALAFALDSRTLYSGASDGSIAAWHLTRGGTTGAHSQGIKKGFL